MAIKWLSDYNTTGCIIVRFELSQSSQHPNLDLIRHHQGPQGLTHWNNSFVSPGTHQSVYTMAIKWLSDYNTTGCIIVRFELTQSSQEPNSNLERHH